MSSSLPTKHAGTQPDNTNVFHQAGDIPTNSYAQHGDESPMQRTEEQQCHGTPVNLGIDSSHDLFQHADDDLTRSTFLKDNYVVVNLNENPWKNAQCSMFMMTLMCPSFHLGI